MIIGKGLGFLFCFARAELGIDLAKEFQTDDTWRCLVEELNQFTESYREKLIAINAALTVVLCPNSVINNGWTDTIRNAAPEARIATKTLAPAQTKLISMRTSSTADSMISWKQTAMLEMFGSSTTLDPVAIRHLGGTNTRWPEIHHLQTSSETAERCQRLIDQEVKTPGTCSIPKGARSPRPKAQAKIALTFRRTVLGEAADSG